MDPPAPTTLFHKIWAAHEVAPGLLWIDLHLVHEVTSPQAFDGLRLAGRTVRRPGSHARHRRPQRADRRHADRRAHQGPAQPRAGPDARAQLRGVRHPRLLAGLRAPGHRPRHRARARRHAAGHDDRLRRQPHGHARRVRRARLRDRHERGRARARDAVPRRAQAALDADRLHRRAGLRRHRQGPHPRDDRPDGRRRRRRPRRRVRRPGDRGALDGGPHDRLQHDDRGRRPGRHDRARRDDVRLGRRARRDRDPRRVARAAAPTRARRSTARSPSTRARSARRSPGARRPTWSPASPRPCPQPTTDGPRARAAPTWASRPARRSRRSRWTACSSARARTAASATCASPPRSSRAARSPSSVQRDGRAGLGAGQGAGRARGPRRDLPRGRLRLARRGLLDVPGDEPRHARARRALRLDVQPQLRGPPGPRRAHAPRLAADGGRRRDRRPLRRHQGSGASRAQPSWKPSRGS